MKKILSYLLTFLNSYSISQSQTAAKLCINCKYYKPNYIFISDYKFGKCYKFPRHDEDNTHLVTGGLKSSKTDYYHCSTLRTFEEFCGKNAKYFESK